MPKEGLKKLNIFIASPSDVLAEKARLISVVEQLNHGLADYLGLVLDVLEWSQVVPNMGRGQKVIFDQIPIDQWDILIGILWLRYGTPSGGTNPEGSGTHEEFDTAYEWWRKTGKPRIMFYRCIRPPEDITKIDPDSFTKINGFFKTFETGGNNQGLYRTFDTTDNFERLVHDHLTKILIEYIEKERGKTLTPQEIQVYAPKVPVTLPRRAPFFGRKNEISKALRALNPEDRGWGVVIDGIGGIGKTALAIEIAYLCKENGNFNSIAFVSAKSDRLEPAGIQKVPLATTTLDALINELARAIGQPRIAHAISEQKGFTLIDALRGTKSLIILDNLETLASVEQNAISDLLRNLPVDCKAIVTSRHRTGEAAATIRLGQLHWKEARQLIESEMVRHPDVKRIFKRAGELGWKQLYDEAGGSPLVLMWVIGYIRAKRFTFRRALDLLRDGNVENDLNTFVFRQTQILMDANEKTALDALSFFGGSASFDALSNTANIDTQSLELVLERLNTLSLVEVVESADEQERFILHPLTKQFARADLINKIEARQKLENRFVQYWADYAKQYGGTNDKAYQTYYRLDAEWANLDTVINRLWEQVRVHHNSIDDKDAAALMIDLEIALSYFLWSNGYWDESILLASRVYEIQSILKNWQSVRYLTFWLSFICLSRNDLTSAEIWSHRCMEAQQLDGDYMENPDLLILIGQIAQRSKNYSEAEDSFKRFFLYTREVKNINMALIFAFLGLLDIERTRSDEANGYYNKALEFAHDIELESKETQPYFRNTLGRLALELGLYIDARKLFQETIVIAREVGNIEAIANSQFGLARLTEAEGQTDLALPLAQEALKIYERLQHKDLTEAIEFVEKLKIKIKKEEMN